MWQDTFGTILRPPMRMRQPGLVVTRAMRERVGVAGGTEVAAAAGAVVCEGDDGACSCAIRIIVCGESA